MQNIRLSENLSRYSFEEALLDEYKRYKDIIYKLFIKNIRISILLLLSIIANMSHYEITERHGLLPCRSIDVARMSDLVYLTASCVMCRNKVMSPLSF